MSMIRILFLGDIVGEPGRSTVIEQLPILKEREAIDFIVVNGENAAGGRGITQTTDFHIGVTAELDLDSNMNACVEIATRAMIRLAAS